MQITQIMTIMNSFASIGYSSCLIWFQGVVKIVITSVIRDGRQFLAFVSKLVILVQENGNLIREN